MAGRDIVLSATIINEGELGMGRKKVNWFFSGWLIKFVLIVDNRYNRRSCFYIIVFSVDNQRTFT